MPILHLVGACSSHPYSLDREARLLCQSLWGMSVCCTLDPGLAEFECTSECTCCDRCIEAIFVNVFLLQMFLSIGFAALGIAGAVYSLSVAALGLSNGPLCLIKDSTEWGRPFEAGYENQYIDFITNKMSYV